MIIKITADLTIEQATLLAKEKGYSDKIYTIIDANATPMVTEEAINTETPYEYLKKVYEAMIINDAQKHYLEVYERNRKAEQETEVEQIKAQVVSSVTSSVE